MKEHFISVYQARCAASIVDKYMDTDTFNTSKNIYNITIPSDVIFTKYDVSTSDDQVEKFTR